MPTPLSISRPQLFLRIAFAVLAFLPGHLWAAYPPGPTGQGGAVASAEAAATEVGIELLRAGGNAVDAAVATALALAVVHPEAGNLGGGGFAVLRIDGEIATLDFRETAPSSAHAEMYRDEEGRLIPKASLVGPLATGIPGSPAGYWELHRKFGRLPWPRVVAPALRLAEEGFVVSLRLRRALLDDREDLERFPETAAVWLPGGEPPSAGSRMRLPALARTLRAYASQGPEAITSGSLAVAIEAASDRYGGILTAEDLAAYRPVWREPLLFSSHGWQMAGMGLPSSGGLITATTLELLNRTDWRSRPRFGADRAHLLAEAFRRAYADRFLLGDPESMEIDFRKLIEPDRLSRLAFGIDPAKAAVSDEIGPGNARYLAESSETTHISVVDGDGNLVSMTSTLNGSFGCGLLVPETGFILNNEMDDFAAAPGEPNLFGLIQGEANTIRPGRRMLSSQSPMLAWNQHGDALVLGGRGGSRIPTGTIQVLLNVLADGDSLQTAVDRPRLHHQWLPDRLDAEADALSPETRAELEKRGHVIRVIGKSAKVHAVRLHADGSVEAAADPRGPGVGAVVTAYPLPPDPMSETPASDGLEAGD